MRVNRRMLIRIVKLWRSTNDVLMCCGSGSPVTVLQDTPMHFQDWYEGSNPSGSAKKTIA